MSTGGVPPAPVFDCIPNLGAHVPVFFQPLVRQIKCCKPNGNQLYSVGYAGVQVADYLFSGIGPTGGVFTETLQDAQYWFARPAIFLVLPWLLLFIAIFIYMGFTGLMSMFAAVIFITMVLLIGAFTIFIVIWETRNLLLNAEGTVSNFVTTTINNARNTVMERWNTYETQLVEYLLNAYTIQNSCDDENNVCCGFNPDICTSQCTARFTIEPNIVAPGTTGTMTLHVEGTATTGGFYVIPPEINGGVTGTTIPFTGNTPVTFNYSAQSIETVANVTAVAYCSACGFGENTLVLSQNVIITSAVTATMFSDNNLEENTAFREETEASIIQLQQTLQDAQLIQERLQQRISRPIQQNQRAGCVGCVKNRVPVSHNR
jgi:hypothetical protein